MGRFQLRVVDGILLLLQFHHWPGASPESTGHTYCSIGQCGGESAGSKALDMVVLDPLQACLGSLAFIRAVRRKHPLEPLHKAINKYSEKSALGGVRPVPGAFFQDKIRM